MKAFSVKGKIYEVKQMKPKLTIPPPPNNETTISRVPWKEKELKIEETDVQNNT